MGLPLPEAGLTQAVFPIILLICTTGTSSTSAVYEGFDWAGPAQLVDPLVLANHMAFAKCVSQCLNVPPPSALSVVFSRPLYI